MMHSTAQVVPKTRQITLYAAPTTEGVVASFRRNGHPAFRLRVDQVERKNGRVVAVQVHHMDLNASGLLQQINAGVPLKLKVANQTDAALLGYTTH